MTSSSPDRCDEYLVAAQRGERATVAHARRSRHAPTTIQARPDSFAFGGKPKLVFFFSERSGACRRAEAYLAQVLQRRRNHDTFRIVRVAAEQRPDLLAKFRVADVPTLIVIEGQAIKCKIVKPRGRADIEERLRPWLR